jgi:enterochelin esterase-like enzyme
LFVDGVQNKSAPGPVVVRLDGATGGHEVVIEINVSGYERRIACSSAPRVGTVGMSREGLGEIVFESPSARTGGGKAVVFMPPNHDPSKPGPLLVGAHPWDGGIWTYAAYAQLLDEATKRDVVLLMPSGLGNSLYTAPAEDEVLRAIDALAALVAIDSQRISIWGASMGGAGATTIGLHHPDRFASIVSFFGDSKYDLSTYVRTILPNETAAHAVNALDVVDNARHVPIWLIHGTADRVSPIRQSEMLASALSTRGFAVRFDRVEGEGHSGALVARLAAEVVDRAAAARAPARPGRVSWKSVRATDVGAYGVRIARAAGGDAFVDVERRADGVHVLRAENVRSIGLTRGALGALGQEPIFFEPGARRVEALWEEAR